MRPASQGRSWSAWRSTASRTCSSTSILPATGPCAPREPARRAAGAVGARHAGPAAGLPQPADRRGRPGGAVRTASVWRLRRADARRGPLAGAGERRPIPLDQHQRFLAHMAALHAAFWECGPEVDVVPTMHRYLELSPWLAEAEAETGSDHLVPQLVGQGLAHARGRLHPPPLRWPGRWRAIRPAGRGTRRHAADLRAQQLEAGQPRHRRAGPDCPARLGAAGARRRADRSGLVPGHQLPSAAGVQGGLDRGRTARSSRPAVSTPSPGGTGS